MNEPSIHPRSRVVTDADIVNNVDPADPDVGDTAALANSAAGSSALKVAIVGPSHPDEGEVAAHTTSLAHQLARSGHDVTLVSWLLPFAGRRSPEVPALTRTVRALSWARPQTWVRTGRRLRGFDAIIVMHTRPREVPVHLAMLRAAGVGGGAGDPSGVAAPRSIVIAHHVLPRALRPGDSRLTRSLFERVDAVMVHSPEQALLARGLNAGRVCVANAVHVEPPQGTRPVQAPELSSSWAHYVGALEALASPHWQATQQDPQEVSAATSLWARVVEVMPRVVRRPRPTLSMTRVDLPTWVRPSDVLGDGADADEARDWARSFGLPRCADTLAAWSALGALAAIVRLSDDGHHSALIVDGSGAHSPLSGWARAIGFAPVELDLGESRSSVSVLDVDTASLDVITRLHPNGCDSQDVDEALSQASWALRSGGLISLTLPMGPATAEGAVGPADVRAILARAHTLGFVLVGDPDGDITALMRAAGDGERRSDAAYALVRLTFRRR